MITPEDLELAETTTDPKIQLFLVQKMIDLYYGGSLYNSESTLFHSLFENPNLIPDVQQLMLFKFVASINDKYIQADRMLLYPHLDPNVFEIILIDHSYNYKDDMIKVLKNMQYKHPETQRKLELWKLLG